MATPVEFSGISADDNTTNPSFLLYLMALLIRLSKICFNRCLSALTYNEFSPVPGSSNLIFRSLA